MKKKPTPFLDFYNECVWRGKMRQCGLCIEFVHSPQYETLVMFMPEDADKIEFNKEIHSTCLGSYWGSGDRFPRQMEFTEFRQTIVLFCAAINGELES